MAERKYDASSIKSLKDDRERVRKRPSQFIVNTYAEGAEHIQFEIVDNGIDECDAIGKGSVTMSFDDKTLETVVIDTGSGIPHEKMFDALTVLNTSGKFDNDDTTPYTYSGGVFGVGLKCAVYLSKRFEATSMRDGKSLTYVFEDGILVDTKHGKTKEHGTIIRFTIDRKIIEIDKVEPAHLLERMREKSYCFPDLKLTYIWMHGGDVVKMVDFEGNTLMDLVKHMKPDTQIFHVEDTRKVSFLKRATDDEVSEVKVIVDVSFAFSEKALDLDTDAMIVSYANSIKTYDGGEHVTGLKQGIQKFIRDYAIPRMSKKDQELQIMPSDITAGLCGVVSVKISKPEFSAQHKSRLSNQEVRQAVRDAVFEFLCDQKNSTTNQIVDFVKRVARGRLASKKQRKKDVDNAFSKDRIKKYNPIIYNLKTVHPELLLLEGDSAANLATSARDPYNQAIYMIQKPKNVYDLTPEELSRVTASAFNRVCDIAGIIPGPKCNPETATVEKILGLPDADVDGDGIFNTIAGLFAKHCKPCIDAGMIGRIIPPAYSFPDGKGKKTFIRSKRDFYEFVMKRFSKENEISKGGHEFSKNRLQEFLEINFDYDKKLEKLANRYCCDPSLMEYIAWKYHGDEKNQTKAYWTKMMKPYGELKVLVEDGLVVIDGDLPGYDYINLAFDETFDRHVKKFKEIQSRNDSIDNFELNGKKATLYDIMHAFRTYMPKGIERFKGLGELETKDMKNLCMDRDKRSVIIMKFKDYEKDMAKIDIMLSTREAAVRARAEIARNTLIDESDLDT